MKVLISLIAIFILDTSYGRDDLIVPGNSVGIINSATSLQKMKKSWGDHNIRTISFPSDEGLGPNGFVAFEKFKDRKIIGLHSSEEKQDVIAVRIIYPSTYWRTLEGVRTGISLNELETINDGPVTFNTLRNDFGWTIESFGEGKIGNKYSKMGILLGCIDDKICDKLMGRKEVKTSDLSERDKENIIIQEIRMNL